MVAVSECMTYFLPPYFKKILHLRVCNSKGGNALAGMDYDTKWVIFMAKNVEGIKSTNDAGLQKLGKARAGHNCPLAKLQNKFPFEISEFMGHWHIHERKA